jgi:phenylacetate-CoA ligase
MNPNTPIRTRPLLSPNTFARRVWLPINDFIAGSDISRQLTLLEQSQWWKTEDLQEYQNKRLRSLIHHAYTHVPYYHDLFRSLDVSPSDIKTKEDLVKLPILTKEDIRKSPERFIAQNIPHTSLIHETTSGSSGKVFEYVIDKNVLSISRALGLRGWGFAGYSVGDNIVTLAGSSLLPKNVPLYTKIRFKFSQNLPLSSYNLNKERLDDYLQQIIKFNPRFIRGYPSSIALLARHALEHGIDAVNTNGVMTTAETLSKSQREIISLAFHCDVFDQFGCIDGGENASECDQHRGYHISVERSVHEFLDDNGCPVASGENGHIILTDLWNYAMPFIRYNAGDMGVPTDRTCPCGRGLPLLERITGRTVEQIVLPDGQRLPGLPLTDVFDHGDVLTAVRDYQIIQEKVDEFVVNIVKSDCYSPAISKEIQEFMWGHLGRHAEIRFNILDEIPRTDANKRRILICKVNNVKNQKGN